MKTLAIRQIKSRKTRNNHENIGWLVKSPVSLMISITMFHHFPSFDAQKRLVWLKNPPNRGDASLRPTHGQQFGQCNWDPTTVDVFFTFYPSDRRLGSMKIQDIWWVFVQDPNGFSGYVQEIGIHESSAKTAQLMLT